MSADYRMDTNRRTGEAVCSRCGGDHRASLFTDSSAYGRLLVAMEDEAKRRTEAAARIGSSEHAEAWLHTTSFIRELHHDLMPTRDCYPRFAGAAWEKAR